MILISHRGNISGTSPNEENSPAYIDKAIEQGYDVEIDIRYVENQLFLGHDTPDFEIDIDWLLSRKDRLWIHTKNFEALNQLISCDLKIFFHEKESQTIINNCNLIWSHDLSSANSKSIIPLLTLESAKLHFNYPQVYGICSDYVELIRDIC